MMLNPACNFTKKRLQHRCFPVNIAKVFRKGFLKHLWWLLLYNYIIYRSMNYTIKSSSINPFYSS